jgi:hypothetical protein
MKTSPYDLNSKISKTSLCGYPWEPELQNFEYAGHQVSPNDPGSRNFSSLGLMV